MGLLAVSLLPTLTGLEPSFGKIIEGFHPRVLPKRAC